VIQKKSLSLKNPKVGTPFYFLAQTRKKSSRIFQRFLLVKFIEKFKTLVKNLKIEKIIAFDKYLHELFFAFYFHLSKNLILTIKNNEVPDLTHFSSKCGCFYSF